LGEERR
jgi:hypothetical protein